MKGHDEIAEAIKFDGARALFPKAATLISRLARLEIDDMQSEADLRQLLVGFVLEARDILPEVPPWSGSRGRGDS